MFDNRVYRNYHQKEGLVSFDITVKETNLNIQAESDFSRDAVKAVLECRGYIETYIRQYPDFASSLTPLPDTGPAPGVIQGMLTASRNAGVGPMAAVAGAVAEYTGQQLLERSPEILVENGGDIFIKSDSDTVFGIYAEDSPFFMKTGIKVKKRAHAYGMCTSSGMLGHSKSFGKADAASVLADSCPFADAVATALGNRVADAADIKDAIEWSKSLASVQGVVIIKGDKIGLWGDLELVSI